MQISSKLKSLQSERAHLEHKLKGMKRNQDILTVDISQTIQSIESIDNQIKKLTSRSNEIIVTEHAFVRYFERILQYNLEEVRSWILSPHLLSQIKAMGDGTYKCANFRAVVKNNTIVSILTVN